MEDNLNSKVKTATKWSAITEIAAKLVAPISTMVLARLLNPEAFGVLVTATMVISFAEIFTDAGFQKYIIQKDFDTEEQLFNSTAVAFWSNLFMSIVIWIVIAIFSSQIARLVGNDGYGFVIAISCVCIPLAAFSSIQMALFKRWLDFKTLFTVRIVGILIPLVITIPLAFFTRNYWSLVIGMIALNTSNAVLLTIKSRWKPRWFYSWNLFKDMFSFTMWSMVEAISIWFTNYLDVFIVGSVLSTYYMGIYRTSINTVSQIMTVITAATTPVLFSALSRLQNDQNGFQKMFFTFQKMVGLLVIPMGVGIFIFSDLITSFLLGDQWEEAANFIGWWGLTSSITIVLSHYSSEIYRSKGKPKLSFFSQILHLFFLVPTVLIAVNYGFETLYISRSLVRIQGIIVNMFLLFWLVSINPLDMLKNIMGPVLASISMVIIKSILPETDNMLIQFSYIFVCTAVYISTILMFPDERKVVTNTVKTMISKMYMKTNKPTYIDE